MVTGSVDPVFDAVRSSDQDELERLLHDDPSLAAARNGDGLSIILVARYRFNMQAVERLLAARPALDVFDAAAVGDVERLRALLAEDTERATAYNVDGFTALGLASFFDHPEAVRLLLDAGAEVAVPSRNAQQVQPLHSAAAARGTEICALLLDRGADVNARQHGGFTPLHAAGQHGDLPLARLLLNAGADRSLTTDDGKTAFTFAEEGGHTELAALLRE